MEELISGIERELGSSTPSRATLELNALRVRAKARRIVRGRKRFEQELETFIAKNAAVRSAAVRHLGTSMTAAIIQANAALKKADKLIARTKVRIKPKI